MPTAVIAAQSLVNPLLGKVNAHLFMLKRNVHQARDSEAKLSQIGDRNTQLSGHISDSSAMPDHTRLDDVEGEMPNALRDAR